MRLLVACCFLLTSLIHAQAETDYVPEEISDNLYFISNPLGGNIAFLVTRKGVIVVDAGSTPANGEQIIASIKSVTKKPIKYLILTHLHGDHTNGISAFPNDVEIIAHNKLEKNYQQFNSPNITHYKEKLLPAHLASLKEEMDKVQYTDSLKYADLVENYNKNIDYLENIKRIEFRTPDITFEDYYLLKLGGERIVLEYVGPGHTNDNIVVKFSNHNVIHTGDLVFDGTFPYLITEHGVDVYNWIKILDDLYKENIFTVIPGHGDVGRKVALMYQSDYFKDLSRKIGDLKEEGFNLEEIKRKIGPQGFDLQGNEEQLPVNIEVIYTELVNKGVHLWEF